MVKGEWDVPELKELKELEGQIRSLKKNPSSWELKVKPIVVKKTRVDARLFKNPLLMIPKAKRAKMHPFLEGVDKLEVMIGQKDYVSAIELYLKLNRKLQQENTLSFSERAQMLERLLKAYRRIRMAFYKDN